MMYWTMAFLLIAILIAEFGSGGVAADAGAIAKILFIVFLVLYGIDFVHRW